MSVIGVKLLKDVYRNFTSYDLFAVVVVSMVVGHVFYYFVPDQNWLRIVDRILVPVFLVTVGYNTSHKFGWMVWAGAFIVAWTHYVGTGIIFINVLGTFIFVRAFMRPFLDLLLKSSTKFWAWNIIFVLVSPVVNLVLEYGTLAISMAVAGWINRNREEVKEIVNPKHFFVFITLGYLYFTEAVFMFSQTELAIVAIGSIIVMTLLYDFRTLLLNAVHRRPKDKIEKFVSFVGRKSLEIYVIHVVVFNVMTYSIFKFIL